VPGDSSGPAILLAQGAIDVQPLFTCGDLVLDVVASVASTLDRDTDTPGEVRSAPGGSAANFAVWTRRLGDPVRFAGRVGDDLLGRALVDDMRREGIETHIALDAHYPTAVLVLFSEGSQRHMMVPRGANHFFDADDIPADAVRTAGWLHLTGYSFFWEGPKRAALKALALAREAGVPVSLDPSSAGFIRRHGFSLPPGVRILLPNREECAALTGLDDVAEGARLLSRQAEMVAVKLGPEGALLAFEGRLVHVPPAPVDGPAIDATGAGDAWGAAFVHGLRTGLEPVEAARRANRLGARVVARMGARPAVPLDG
jgi:sugar/nucleoside kinase (ribokinase family)